jgi:hypothetical protein
MGDRLLMGNALKGITATSLVALDWKLIAGLAEVKAGSNPIREHNLAVSLDLVV